MRVAAWCIYTVPAVSASVPFMKENLKLLQSRGKYGCQCLHDLRMLTVEVLFDSLLGRNSLTAKNAAFHEQ